MFKKSLITLAALGAFAGAAMAADVTVYGVIDTGFAYTHDKTAADYQIGNKPAVKETIKDDHFRMDTGNNSATRFGLKGTEDLGNGLQIGFVLENGFDSDTGELTTDDTIFDRQATLSVGGGFGTVYMGRMSTLISDTGSVGFYGSMASAFGSGWSDNIAGHTAVMASYTTRYDNTVAYVSPEFAGVKVYAQYAMGDSDENTHRNDRYAALGAEWKGGPFDLGVLVDWLDKDATAEGSAFDADPNIEDQYTVNLAGSYDCGFAKTFLALQYFKDARDAGGILDNMGFFDTHGLARNERDVTFNKAAFALEGYGAHIGTTFEALGGTWLAGIGYMDGEANYAHDGHVADVKAYSASLGYEYALSKRTKLYSGVGYLKQEADGVKTGVADGSWEYEGYDVITGLVHTF